MLPDFLDRECAPLAANVPAGHIGADAAHWREAAEALQADGANLLTLWGADDRDRDGRMRIHAAYLLRDRVIVVEHAMPAAAPVYPALAARFPVAVRMQRAIFDLLGIQADGGDTRPWLRHGGWPERVYPLRRDVGQAQTYPAHETPYPFVRVEGEGVHEVTVGPIHAGTIEPGHFRMSVVGEKVLRLEIRLGYTHRGIAKRFEALALAQGHRLAARICGDSTVAYAWAYCAAYEAIAGTAIPPRAAALRALALERERIANHLGDLGALGNDAGFAFGLTQFSSLKERLLRHNANTFGQRYLFDYVVPGGVAADLPASAPGIMLEEIATLERSVRELRAIYDDHAGLQDRFRGSGRVTPEQARTLGAIGLVGRASGIARDLRADLPWTPYAPLEVAAAACAGGDVAARVEVRFEETLESLRLCRRLLETLPQGAVRTELPPAPPARLGLGLVEGWRGPVLVALEAGANGTIRRCHTHDPSWQNWPLVEYAALDNIVPDFPLINKSFNLSYSGHDG
ncbi:MAG: NADH-quinone oxidoreductase subunit C [Mizugakiibacter sp.]|uniref:hydrogenase large subunit n=1 Tax=Mizugakiibacter sp. TaxID=1972610 RepID=UPI0031C7FF16|nr:NADH-quinone oxidoreductase subunit C [Xanthomonadaceae bacterium]